MPFPATSFGAAASQAVPSIRTAESTPQGLYGHAMTIMSKRTKTDDDTDDYACEFFVHIRGPEELECFESEDEAEAVADAYNRLFADLNASFRFFQQDPLKSMQLRAVVGIRRGRSCHDG